METNEIFEDLKANEKAFENGEKRVGAMIIKPANTWMEEAKEKKDPERLWKSFWHEGELSVLFADSNVGKSVLAVQIAESISKQGKPVLYFDFEMTDKQFQMRYTNENGEMYHFSPNFNRAEIDTESIDVSDDHDDKMIEWIESAGDECGAKILIIDNLSWLNNNSEKGEFAGKMMKALSALKKKGYSALVLSHTPKRNMASKITQNDLGGSKKIMNFIDSSFAIGQSVKGDDVRYIKQVKGGRGTGPIEYGEHHVLECQLKKNQDGFLFFNEISVSHESEHLKELTNTEIQQRNQKIFEMHKNGCSQADIAREVGWSPSTICRILKDFKNEGDDGKS